MTKKRKNRAEGTEGEGEGASAPVSPAKEKQGKSIFVQHTSNEILGFIAYVGPISWVKLELLTKDIFENFFAIISFKGRIAAQEYIQNYAQAPNITWVIVVTF